MLTLTDPPRVRKLSTMHLRIYPKGQENEEGELWKRRKSKKW
jgi:hypothetical protein